MQDASAIAVPGGDRRRTGPGAGSQDGGDDDLHPARRKGRHQGDRSVQRGAGK